MEEKSAKNEIKITRRTEGIIILNSLGKLRFREADFPKEIFSEAEVNVEFITQRKTNKKFILAYSKNKHKIYRIKDNGIEFVSAHSILLPVFGLISKTIISEDRIRLYFKMAQLRNITENQAFFKLSGINEDYNSRLVFECQYGPGEPDVISPRFFVEQGSYYHGSLKSWTFLEYLTTTRPLLNPDLCLIKGKGHPQDRDSSDSSDHSFLGKIRRKKSKKPPKRVFKFMNLFSSLQKYQQELSKEGGYLPELFKEGFRRYGIHLDCPSIRLDTGYPGTPQKVTAALRFDRIGFTFELIDLRSRKIQARAFLSIHEIFEGLEFTKVSKPFNTIITKMDYSAEVDTLVVGFTLSLSYSEVNHGSFSSILDSELRRGRLDKRELTFFCGADNPTIELKKLRFRVSNIFKRKKRNVTVERIGFCENTGFERLVNGILLYRENNFELDIQIERRDGVSDQGQEILEDGWRDDGRLSGSRTSSFFVLNKRIKFPDSNATKLVPISENSALVAGTRKLCLIDLETKKLVSSLDYNLGLPQIPTNVLFDDDLILFLSKNNSSRCIEISKIGTNPKTMEPSFKHIATVDLTGIDPLHSIVRLQGFRRLKDGSYDLRIQANWMQFADKTASTFQRFSLRFKLRQKQEKYEVEILNEKDLVIENIDLGSKAYRKSGSWYDITLSGPKASFCQRRFLFDSDKEENPEKTIFSTFRNISRTRILNAHIIDNLGFVVKESDNSNLQTTPFYGLDLIKIEFEKIENQCLRSEPKITKSAFLQSPVQVFFDEVTEAVRIFCFTQIENFISTRLTILDQEFEVIQQFEMKGLQNIDNFKVLSDEVLHFTAERFEEGELLVKRVSIVLNLSSKEAKEVISISGEPFICTPYFNSKEKKVLAFGRSLSSNSEEIEHGLFFSLID